MIIAQTWAYPPDIIRKLPGHYIQTAASGMSADVMLKLSAITA